MLKNIYQVLLLTLAINFLAVAAGVGWLWKEGRLDKARIEQIKQVLYPPEVAPPEPVDPPDAESPPAAKLDELLAKASGRPAAEQVEFLQRSFDAQTAQLDRRHRELLDLQRQVELARKQLEDDRAALAAGEQKLQERAQLQVQLANDKGFQDSLTLYQSMPARQAKSVFMALDDETVVRYLQAMPPRTASKILKEFKTPEETARVQRVLERMREPPTESAGESASPASQEARQSASAGP